MINTVIITVIIKHFIIPANINNIYKLEEASRALLKELLRIINTTVLRRKLNIGIITL